MALHSRNPGPLESWNYSGGLSHAGGGLVRYIDERLRDLDRYLARVSRAINQGPMAGAYFPLLLRCERPGGANLVAADLGLAIHTNFQMSPHYISGSVDSGSATLQVTDGTDDLLVAPLDTALAEPWFNVASAFVVMRTVKPAAWRLRIESVTGSPKIAQVLLVFTHVAKVDDPQI